MLTLPIHAIVLAGLAAGPLGPGDHTCQVKAGEVTRSYLVHVPPRYDAKKATPVVLALHGAGTNASGMVWFCGLNATADRQPGGKCFIVVYPNGTGLAGLFLTWNAGGLAGAGAKGRADDVAFIRALLDDLAKRANVDARRVYATGMSNGGMMCYRLAAELSDRIAAIAPVAGTMAFDNCNPKRPVPVMHFHGTDDRIVPYAGMPKRSGGFMFFRSVDQTVRAWVKLDGCGEQGKAAKLPDTVDDGTHVTRTVWGPGTGGAEVVLYTIHGGGHTWPGMAPPLRFLGRSTRDISANDLVWEFFQKHPMPAAAGAATQPGG